MPFLLPFFFFENFLMVGFFSFFLPFQGHNNDSLYYQLDDSFFSFFSFVFFSFSFNLAGLVFFFLDFPVTNKNMCAML